MTLSPLVRRHLYTLFAPADRAEAERLLTELASVDVPNDSERICVAALKVSDGQLGYLKEAVELGLVDFRDLLMWAGFASGGYANWRPLPFGAPARVDAAAIENAIVAAIEKHLHGFQRDGRRWRRGQVTIELRRGYTTRHETGFTLRAERPGYVVTVSAEHANSLGRSDYAFEDGDRVEPILARFEADFRRRVLPWLQSAR